MSKKILVVDDEPDVLKSVVFRLQKKGYQVLTATDGQAAMDLVQSDRPDLILLDLQLPVLDGYAVCRLIKRDKSLKGIPVILFTASSGASVAEEIEAAQANDCIVKPFEPEELFTKIEEHLG